MLVGKEDMEDEKISESGSLLQTLPPVEFCCMYGSSLHPNNKDKSSMVDYILGVSDPQQWHSENLKLNKHHYGSWIMRLGGARMITNVADSIGVGVHFNPFVSWENKIYKYGVVRMDDLLRDILEWKRFYLSGRLQKPVSFLVDNLDVESVNSVNLKGATTAALLLLPSRFTEEDLYAKICSLSYMGDLRMLFAEDKDKVKKIVQGQFDIFQTMYKPYLEEYATKELLRFSSSGDKKVYISQDCSLSTSYNLVNSLPQSVKHEMGMRLGETSKPSIIGRVIREVVIGSRKEAAECMTKVLRNKVMASSARQAVAGFVTVGAVNGVRYLARKMNKACKSWT